MKRIGTGFIATIALAAAPAVPALAVTCDLAETVGGGALGVLSPSPGAGWDVGTGQCNGDFTVVRDLAFPGEAGGDGIELGMRAEQRRIGQVNPPDHSGSDYRVQVGEDPGTGGSRAWWNFQHSIAYDGDIGDLDFLTFAIRTDAGSSVPNGPFDMLARRGLIDDRHAPKSTITYGDIYQTSQNPVFAPWFASYDMNEEGAWMLTLAAGEDGSFVHTSICIHTPGAVCGAEPVVYTCSLLPPLHKVVRAKRPGRTIPVKLTCADSEGNELTDADIAPPVIDVAQVDGMGSVIDEDVTVASRGRGHGDAFVYNGGHWQYNLDTRGFAESGMFRISAGAGDGGLLVGPPEGMFVIQ